jgi:hypothetical protein
MRFYAVILIKPSKSLEVRRQLNENQQCTLLRFYLASWGLENYQSFPVSLLGTKNNWIIGFYRLLLPKHDIALI